jgi:hypothetical protein
LPAHCTSADETGECTECEDGYDLNINDECVPEKNDHCNEYGYIDKNGNWSENNCLGCTEVCRKCGIGYYLNKRYKCKKIPKNCAQVNLNNGKCIKCLQGYELNKNGKCRKK